MSYRTRTYIAGAWEEDSDAIEKLYEWNKSDSHLLSFVDVHSFKQARDSSLPCSIKNSLSERMDMCKLFILVVGEKTNTVTKGSCVHCQNYHSWSSFCASGKTQNTKSFIDFECDKAKREFDAGNIKVLVLYNSSRVYKDRCPESLRNIGTHLAMIKDGKWNYMEIKMWILLWN